MNTSNKASTEVEPISRKWHTKSSAAEKLFPKLSRLREIEERSPGKSEGQIRAQQVVKELLAV